MAVQNRAPDKVVEYIGDGTIDLDGDTFIFAMLNNTHVYNAANDVLADVVANEISGNGYGRDTLAATWVESAGTVTFDSDDPTFTASGGSIVASDGVLFDDTPTTPVIDPIIVDIDFDGDQTAGDGTQFIVSVNASGWFTAAYADA